MEKICRACEIAANDELVKQMPMHTCGKDGPIENADALKSGMKEQDAAHSFEKSDLTKYCETLESELTRLRSELQQLKAWKESELKLWGPILEFMRTHPDRRLGESIPDRVLEFLKEHSRLKSELQQKDEIIKELVNVAARISIQLKKGDSYRVHIESLIKKANVF